MQVPYAPHIFILTLFESWIYVEHYELEHQSVGRKKSQNFAQLERSQYEMANLGCSIWRWKPCSPPIVFFY